MTGRRAVLASLGLGLLAPCLAGAQSPRNPSRIFVLGLTPFNATLSEEFRQGLSERGHLEGRHYRLDVQDAGGKPEQLRDMAAAGMRGSTDLVLVRGAGALAAAKAASSTIPIVAVDLESDPVATGAVRSLAQPGGNITGVFLDFPDLTAKQLQLLKEVIPTASRVAVFGDSSMNAPQFRAAESAARAMGLGLQRLEVRATSEIEEAFDAARRKNAHAMLILSSPLVFYHRANLGDLAVKTHLPAVSMFVEFAEAGGLLAYGPSLRESFRRAGVFAARILEGAKPAVMPVERPSTFELVVNRTTAKALGLTLPAALARRADRLIE